MWHFFFAVFAVFAIFFLFVLFLKGNFSSFFSQQLVQLIKHSGQQTVTSGQSMSCSIPTNLLTLRAVKSNQIPVLVVKTK